MKRRGLPGAGRLAENQTPSRPRAIPDAARPQIVSLPVSGLSFSAPFFRCSFALQCSARKYRLVASLATARQV
jgi:hypothetical protein